MDARHMGFDADTSFRLLRLTSRMRLRDDPLEVFSSQCIKHILDERSYHDILTSTKARRTLMSNLDAVICFLDNVEDRDMRETIRRRKTWLTALRPIDNGPCPLMDLPREVRDMIWSFAVTDWASAYRIFDARRGRMTHILQKAPIRIDRLNLSLPPAVTLVSSQVRSETLPLYYAENTFEFWRPLSDLGFSLFANWLRALGRDRSSLSTNFVLMYKYEDELNFDVEDALLGEGLLLKPGVITYRRELNEYEMRPEEWGLPCRFGRGRRRR